MPVSVISLAPQQRFPCPRSLLFVPGDRPDRMQKAAISGADAIILDLEDSVASGRKAHARGAVGDFLTGREALEIDVIVRINPIDAPDCMLDLDLLGHCRPTALMLPKSEGAKSVLGLLEMLKSPVPILPIAAETPASLFSLGDYAAVREHLFGLTWGAEDLAVSLGLASSRSSDGRLLSPLETARHLTLFAAGAAETAAIETVFADVENLEDLGAAASRAALDGFSGMMAIHPSQVPIINTAFSPTTQQVEEASAIIRLFAENPGTGVMMRNGKMIDRPHYIQAQTILARAGKGTN